MAISNVVKHGTQYWIYDEKGHRVGTICSDNDLVGFTATTVSIRHGNQIWIHDERGHRTGTCMG